MVVHGEDGLDEISITSPTTFAEVRGGQLKMGRLSPEDFGMKRGTMDELRGGDAALNAQIILRVLEGEAGPRGDIVLLNAGAALYVAGAAADLAAGVEKARQSIASGAALKALNHLRDITNQSGGA
jgi:anthranilate phosphoribosyltransferase